MAVKLKAKIKEQFSGLLPPFYMHSMNDSVSNVWGVVASKRNFLDGDGNMLTLYSIEFPEYGLMNDISSECLDIVEIR